MIVDAVSGNLLLVEFNKSKKSISCINGEKMPTASEHTARLVALLNYNSSSLYFAQII